MKCPKCGKEILDGHMYCEVCGEEIKLVPEFEAQVEESMAESIQGIVEKAMDEGAPETEASKPTKKGRGLFYVSSGLVSIFVFVAVALIIAGVTVWNQSTFMQEMLVEYHLDDGDYDKAISYMEEIIRKAPDKVSHRFNLCKIYLETGQADKALEMYKMIIAGSQYELDEQVAAAEQIVNYYVAGEDYEGIADFLETVQDSNIRLAFLEYMSGTVGFSQPEGTYASLITIKLSCDGIGSIYYTTDGTTPTEQSEEFSGPIFLEAGDNEISAVFVNEYGVMGPVVTKNYFIESKKVTPPEVATYSGTYNCPVMVEVEVKPDTRIYYTTDGSAPNMHSSLYTNGFYAPLGKSVYKFIAVSTSGEVSEVVTREINVVLDTQMTTEEATDVLVDYLISRGASSDGKGHLIQDDTHILVYEYLYPMTVEVGRDCYYFAEVSRNTTTAEQFRTGKYYGVDVRTKEIYIFS